MFSVDLRRCPSNGATGGRLEPHGLIVAGTKLGQRIDTMSEIEKIRERYARRVKAGNSELYDPLLPSVYLSRQEFERALVRWIKVARIAPLHDKTLLEIGCGGGGTLRELLRLGFSPELAVGDELIPERAQQARRNLPPAVHIIEGDALKLELPKRSFDVVLQSTVFSSILSDDFQGQLAALMWDFVKPGGGVLWYDFVFNNPKNHDVRGVSLRRVRSLFPEGKLVYWRITLAPPISRVITNVHPSLYYLFNSIPALRTHLLCWIQRAD